MMCILKQPWWYRKRCMIFISFLTALTLLSYGYRHYKKEKYIQYDAARHAGHPAPALANVFFPAVTRSQPLKPPAECKIPKLTVSDDYFNYFEKSKTPCSHLEQIGGITYGKTGIKDGDKWVCLDQGFNPGDCVVYSFGISNEWSFDDAMAKKGCKVYAFDPTMGVANHKRSQNIMFYNLGLGDRRETRLIGGKSSQLESFEGIVKMLHHENTKIDYLKMDIEGFELQFFNDVLINKPHLLNNVQQIGMEVHENFVSDVPTDKIQKYWNHYHKLECLGFRLLKAENNEVPINLYTHKGKKRSACHELVWLKP